MQHLATVESIMKYLFNNVEFEPDGVTPLIVNGEIRKVEGQKPLAVLKYLLDHNGQLQERDDILLAVWGPGEHSFNKLTTVCARINQALKGAYQLKSVRNKGYYVDVELSIVKPSKNKPTVIFEKPPIHNKPTTNQVVVLVIMCLILAFMGFYAALDHPANISPNYALTNVKQVFTRDYAVSSPRLSPDGKYIAHQIAKKTFHEGYLSITNLQTSATQKLNQTRYGDGFSWNFEGNKIVYQTRINDNCEIRLVHLNANKSQEKDELLTLCSQNSGVLSFAWFNQHEFYLNAIDEYTSGLPLHQLYKFNINTKAITKVLSTVREGGVGFYSLEYDKSLNTLYFLKVNKQSTTDLYSFSKNTLSKLRTIPHQVFYYAATDNRFLFVDDNQQLVISEPIKNASSNKILTSGLNAPMSSPTLVNNKLAFLTGKSSGFSLQKWQQGNIDIGKYEPYILVNYQNSLVFVSNQTGLDQLFQIRFKNGNLNNEVDEIKQISQFTDNQLIEHITAANNLFAISYADHIKFYRFEKGQMYLVKTLPDASNAVLSKYSDSVLITKKNNQSRSNQVIELDTKTFTPTGFILDDVEMATFAENYIIYINKENELIKVERKQHLKIGDDFQIASFTKATVNNSKLYYIPKHSTTQNKNIIQIYDLHSAENETIEFTKVKPTHLAVVDNGLYVRVQEYFLPDLLTGTITPN